MRSWAVIRPGGSDAAGVGEAHARVLRVVLHVHDAVAIAVVGRAGGAVGVLRVGQLAGVEVNLVTQSARAPVDAGVEDRDDRLGASALGLPGARGVEARDHRLAGIRADRVDRVGRQL